MSRVELYRDKHGFIRVVEKLSDDHAVLKIFSVEARQGRLKVSLLRKSAPLPFPLIEKELKACEKIEL